MKFLVIYRASFYVMLTFATLVLSIDATDDNPIAMLYPMVVALASALAFVTVDRNPRLAPSRSTASVLGIASIGLCLVEYRWDNNLLLLAVAHWLVYLQLIKIFLPKSVEDDWFLFLLGLVQVLVGGVMSQSDKVGIALFCWAIMALWVLTLFALHREALRMVGVPMATTDASVDRAEPYRGLVDAAFLFSTGRIALTTLALGGLIFLAMPRRATLGGGQGGGTVGKHLSGFDDQIKLGRLGEILENDSIVMSIEMFDRDGERVVHDTNLEYRWRGVSMDRYEDGSWFRPKCVDNGYGRELSPPKQDTPFIRQVIKLEPTDSPVLFGLRPILEIETTERRTQPEVNEVDGSLCRGDSKSASLDYQVKSSPNPEMPQPGESDPTTFYRRDLLAMAPELAEKIRPIALEVVQDIPEDDLRGRAMALEQYLRTSGQFRYTLQMSVEDRSLDPVLDFLVNRKAGHCEYFASALALMLRSVGIPARMINGFKGGDYNGMIGVTTVRQKHAHSWVEALVGNRDGANKESKPYWITLDPTPADQRNASVAKVGGVGSNFRQVTDFIRYVWIFYVVGFNSERQDRFLYRPIRDMLSEAQRGFKIMSDHLRALLHFPSVESFFSLRGFLVSFAALLLLVATVRIGAWTLRRLVRRIRGTKAENDPSAASVLFYRRLLQLLAEYGLERPPAETPREFARRSAVFLSGHGSGTEAVADVPPLVVDAFYRIRFGEHTIIEDDFHHVNARLDALEARLHPPKS